MSTELLVLRSMKGDVDAFTDLVRRYERMAFAYALTIIRDYQLAEDATQQSLLTAYRNLSSLRDPDKFGGWLRGIVRFECLRISRDRTRHQSESLDEQRAIDVFGRSVDVESQVEIRGEIQNLIVQMERLPARQRVAAQLYYLGEQSQSEVAEFLGLSVSTVNNRLREARTILRREGVYPMSTQSLNTPSFSDAIGRVIRSEEQTLDIQISTDARPPLLTSVSVGEERAITAFVSQYLDDDVARLLVIDEGPDTAKIPNGTPVRSHGTLTDSQVTSAVIDRLVTPVHGVKEQSVIPTGIKVIDLFAPLVRGGIVAIVGDKNVGKMVVVEELSARLAGEDQQTTVFVFLTTPDELGAAHKLDINVSGPVTAMIVPVADASHEALETSLDRFSTVIAMSGEKASKGLYPAIDPSKSSSIAEMSTVVRNARELVGNRPDDARAQLISAYLTQPFIVAEAYSGRLGSSVSPEQAQADLARILNGDVTEIEPDSLMMRGSLEEPR